MVEVPTTEELAGIVKVLMDRIIALESKPSNTVLPQNVKEALMVLLDYLVGVV